MNRIRIVIAGEGGQGAQTIAKLFALASFENDKEVSYLPNFGVEQRGGVSVAFLQISDEDIPFPKFKFADLLVVLSPRSVERSRIYVTKDTTVIFNSSFIKKTGYKAKKQFGVDATILARDELTPRVFNIIIAGAMMNFIPYLSSEDFKLALKKQLGYKYEKNPELEELNNKAFDMGEKTIKK